MGRKQILKGAGALFRQVSRAESSIATAVSEPSLSLFQLGRNNAAFSRYLSTLARSCAAAGKFWCCVGSHVGDIYQRVYKSGGHQAVYQ